VNKDEKALERKLQAEKAAENYTSGLTLMQVADELSVSYGKAHALVKEGGGAIRPRGTKFVAPASALPSTSNT
jgi:hypothetical protein